MVISITMLEHVPNNTLAVGSMFEALKPGGVTHHYVPSNWHPYSIALRMVGPKLQKRLIATLRQAAAAVTGYPAFFDHCSVTSMSSPAKAGLRRRGRQGLLPRQRLFRVLPAGLSRYRALRELLRLGRLALLCLGFRDQRPQASSCRNLNASSYMANKADQRMRTKMRRLTWVTAVLLLLAAAVVMPTYSQYARIEYPNVDWRGIPAASIAAA